MHFMCTYVFVDLQWLPRAQVHRNVVCFIGHFWLQKIAWPNLSDQGLELELNAAPEKIPRASFSIWNRVLIHIHIAHLSPPTGVTL